MTRKELLFELNHDTYVMLKPSAIDGIGVFALRDIPKGCRKMFTHEQGEWIKLSKSEVASLPGYSKYLIQNFCLLDSENYFVPAHGFKIMELTSYLNHSDTPNIISINDGAFFEAIVPIAAGDELLIDYGTLVDDEHT